jgi:hypothetical protein
MALLNFIKRSNNRAGQANNRTSPTPVNRAKQLRNTTVNRAKQLRNSAKQMKNAALQSILGTFLNKYGINGNDKKKIMSSWASYQRAVNNKNIRKNNKSSEKNAMMAGANLANAVFSINSKTPPPPYDPIRVGIKKGIKSRVIYWAPGVLRRSIFGF